MLVEARDKAGNKTEKSVAYIEFTVDGEKPTVDQTAPSSSIFKNGKDIVISAIDDLSLKSIVGDVYQGDNLYKSNKTSEVLLGKTSANLTISTAGYPSGEYHVRYSALDEAGNESLVKRWYFTVDDARPVVTKTAPAGDIFKPNGTMTFKVTDDASLSLFNVNLYNENCGELIGTLNKASNLQGTKEKSLDVTLPGLASGKYCIKAGAFDEAGNNGTLVYNFTVDGTRPIVTKTATPGDIFLPNSSMTFTVTDDVSLSMFVINLYDGSNSTLLGTVARADNLQGTVEKTLDISLPDLMDGNYCIRAGAFDEGGNNGTLTYCFAIDSTEPGVIIETPTTGQITDGRVTSTGTAIDPSGIRDNKIVVSLGAMNELGRCGTPLASFTVDVAPDGKWTVDFDQFHSPEGDYCISVTATDTVGNSGTTVMQHFVILDELVTMADPIFTAATCTDDATVEFPIAEGFNFFDADTFDLAAPIVLGAEDSVRIVAIAPPGYGIDSEATSEWIFTGAKPVNCPAPGPLPGEGGTTTVDGGALAGGEGPIGGAKSVTVKAKIMTPSTPAVGQSAASTGSLGVTGADSLILASLGALLVLIGAAFVVRRKGHGLY